ncbi:hypothetical protein ACHQM5_015355 [Ranunculus cassubicifolius]
MAEEEVAVIAPIEVSESVTTSDLKRKLEDIEPNEEDTTDAKSSIPDVDLPKDDLILNSSDESVPDAKKPRLTKEESDKPVKMLSPLEDQQQSALENQSTSRKMQVPNNKVGVLIGKAGDTIRFLQLNSGAKIQITRDSEADPFSTTRPVELIGTLDNINKAEKLIKDVIAEAEAGGSPSLVARGFGTVQATGAAEQIQIPVPNEKVGLIIGKGGETIKNMQTRSGARIQLLPQHLSEGDQTKERTVRVTGDKKQIELARDLINEVMSQPVKPLPHSGGGGHNQQGYRPRGPSGQSQWGGRAPPTAQGTGYDAHQRGGMYSSQNPYNRPPYGGYPPQQPGPRGNFNSGWGDQRHGPRPSQSGYNDYYGRGTDSSGPAPVANSGPIPATGHGAPPSHMNYNNYGQSQGPDSYGQPAPYSQPAPSQQSYGYDEQKYANQVPAQPGYGNPQPGNYQQPQMNQQQMAPQSGYGQQPYSKPPTYGGAQSYGPPRADVPYQNPAYGQTAPPQQQSYPYPTGGAPQTYPQGYGSAPLANDGYSQPPTHSASAPVYPQQAGAPQTGPAGYGHPGPQAGAPVYAQGGQPGAYGAYPTQPGYAEQSAATNAGYGYQAPDPNYGGAPVAGYGGAPATQPSYAQQPVQNQPTYEQQQQPVPQAGAYASAPTQMYAGQH